MCISADMELPATPRPMARSALYPVFFGGIYRNWYTSPPTQGRRFGNFGEFRFRPGATPPLRNSEKRRRLPPATPMDDSSTVLTALCGVGMKYVSEIAPYKGRVVRDCASPLIRAMYPSLIAGWRASPAGRSVCGLTRAWYDKHIP